MSKLKQQMGNVANFFTGGNTNQTNNNYNQKNISQFGLVYINRYLMDIIIIL